MFLMVLDGVCGRSRLNGVGETGGSPEIGLIAPGKINSRGLGRVRARLT
jgi:hypothetical protein